MFTDFKYFIAYRKNLIKRRCALALTFLASHNDEFHALINKENIIYKPKALYYKNHKYVLEIATQVNDEIIKRELTEDKVKHFAKYQEYAELHKRVFWPKEVRKLLLNKPIGSFLLVEHPEEHGEYCLCFINKEGKVTFIPFWYNQAERSYFRTDESDKVVLFKHLYDFIKEQISIQPRYLNTSNNYLEAKSRLQPRIICEDFYDEEVPGSVYLEQDEYGDTQPDADSPIIGTTNLWPCIAILIYSKQKSCVLHVFAHYNSEEKIQGLQAVIEEVFGKDIFNNPSSLFVTLAGGMSNSRDFAEEIKKFFQEKNIPFNTQLLYRVRTIALDSRNGHIICGGIIKDNITSNGEVYQGGDRFFYLKEKLYKEKGIPTESIFIKTICNGKMYPYAAAITYPKQLESDAPNFRL